MAEVNEVCSMGLTFDLGRMHFTPVCSILHSQLLWMPFGLLTFLSSHCFLRKWWKLQCVCCACRRLCVDVCTCVCFKKTSIEFFRSYVLADFLFFACFIVALDLPSKRFSMLLWLINSLISYVMFWIQFQNNQAKARPKAQMKSFRNIRPAKWVLHHCEPQLPQKGAARSQRRHQRAVCERETWMYA